VTIIADRYRLERVVGRGGMGEVWLAEDTLLKRRVAAKRIGGAGASDDEVRRAQQEARVTAMLDHEHVVRVFDLALDGADHWLVMEYVESENLSQLVRREGPLDPLLAARLVHQAVQALAAAHGAGIVHRDVKPSNLLVTASGHVKLSDFGIARLETDMGTTRTGLLVGSPGYLAPEVASGGSATPASDMWSLGATLFHAVEGRAPYDTVDGNVVGTLYRIVNDPPPVPTRAGWLAPLVQQLMLHDPAARWDAQRVASYLAGALSEGPPASPPVLRPAPAGASGSPGPDVGESTSVFAVSPMSPESPVATRAAPSNRSSPPGRPTRRILYAVAGLLVVVLLVAGGIALLGRGGGTPSARSTSGPTASPSSSPSPRVPTSAGMEAFVRDYLATAPTDPGTAFQRLTPAYQERSGGLKGYEGFWGTVASAELTRIQADPKARTVSYDVAYRLDDGRRRTDSVTLDLTFTNGTYLIAGEG
jgi:serine/threonine protein kinase